MHKNTSKPDTEHDNCSQRKKMLTSTKADYTSILVLAASSDVEKEIIMREWQWLTVYLIHKHYVLRIIRLKLLIGL